jgi:hypothetical protein
VGAWALTEAVPQRGGEAPGESPDLRVERPGRGRGASIFLGKDRRYIGKCQSQRPPKRTQRPPHHTRNHEPSERKLKTCQGVSILIFVNRTGVTEVHLSQNGPRARWVRPAYSTELSASDQQPGPVLRPTMCAPCPPRAVQQSQQHSLRSEQRSSAAAQSPDRGSTDEALWHRPVQRLCQRDGARLAMVTALMHLSGRFHPQYFVTRTGVA